MKSRSAAPVAKGLLALMLAASALGVGCASPTRVLFEERIDLSPLERWRWARTDEPLIDAPQRDAAALDAALRGRIEGLLAEKGFAYDEADAQFVVSFRLKIAERQVRLYRARASRLVPSYTNAPSWVVGGTRLTLEKRVTLHLTLAAGPLRRPGYWRAEVRNDSRPVFALPLGEALDRLLARFPEHRPCGDFEAQPPLCEPPEEPPVSPEGLEVARR